ncbi:MAG: 2-dehydropantoate 2-reductase [Myxococcota bacterium]|nr:2-dehydropantoate 2-reductase [Deltaproteobacteria bacterium]MDQ3339479.1 2-dehydropantoate 2-reductase [Myxococcota bacterium]
MIAIFGAGAIGCWVGGKLAAGGADVTLIGRARVMNQLAHGLRISEIDGDERTVRVRTSVQASDAARAAITLVTVKSAQTAEAGAALDAVLPDGAVVISLQNGVRNAGVLRAALPRRRVLAAMVPFNVVKKGDGYHRASSGGLKIDDDAAALPFVAACHAAKLPIEMRDDMLAVQWSKLVLNLNNAINALCGLPLAEELSQKPFRRCLAAAQQEAFELLAAAQIPIARVTPIPPRWQPRLLQMPDRLFQLLLPRIVPIDPTARSSMYDDLESKRPTEIDYLQGEVVELARRLGRGAPVNAALVKLVREAEAGGRRDWTGDDLARALGVTSRASA